MHFKPTSSLSHRLAFRVERSYRCLNGLVINARDGGEIRVDCWAQRYVGISLSVDGRTPTQAKKYRPEPDLQIHNQTMKPTAPLRSKFSLFATTPSCGLSLSR
jgi:hypothetical protein